VTDQDRLRATLQETTAALADLQRDYRRLVEASAGANADDEHDPEGATIGFERAQLAAAIERAEQRLGQLRAGLQRLAQGTYGTCESCGRPIGTDRLRARPATTRCRACA
jgi:DnaK suppressor protein